MPIGNLNLPFDAVKDRLPEGDRKADRGVEYLAIVGIVIENPAEVVAVQFKMREEDLV